MSIENYFRDKTVWITGASSGIGEALTKELAQFQCNLVLSSRRQSELERVAEESSIHADRYMILPFDLASYNEIPNHINEVKKRFGKLDILINNGGISQRSIVSETNMDVYEKIMNIDFMGTIALTKGVLAGMIENKSGHIVTVTSVMGIFSSPRRSGYCAAKHALHGFMDSLRAEVYQYNIDVSLIAPGYVRTNVSLNAVSGDGQKTGVMDEATSNGIPPDVFAKKMIAQIAKKKPLSIIAGSKEKAGAFLSKFFPGIFRKNDKKGKCNLRQMTKKDWLIIFFSFLGTMLGVTGAFLLDNWKESSKTNSMKSIALKNIKNEIEDNLDDVIRHKQNLDSLQSVFNRYSALRNSDGDIIATPEEMASFQKDYPSFLAKEDSIPAGDGRYNYNGTTSVNLNLLTLKSISWDTTKELNILQEFSYDCLYELEEVYSLQSVMMVEFEKILVNLQSDDTEKLLNSVSILNQLEVQIIPQYEELLSNIEICK